MIREAFDDGNLCVLTRGEPLWRPGRLRTGPHHPRVGSSRFDSRSIRRTASVTGSVPSSVKVEQDRPDLRPIPDECSAGSPTGSGRSGYYPNVAGSRTTRPTLREVYPGCGRPARRSPMMTARGSAATFAACRSCGHSMILGRNPQLSLSCSPGTGHGPIEHLQAALAVWDYSRGLRVTGCSVGGPPGPSATR